MRKANAAANLVFSPGGVTAVGIVNGNPTMQVNIVAANTNSADLLLNSFAGNLYANGTLIGTVDNFAGVAIPGNTASTIPLVVTLLPLGMVSDIINSFNNKSGIQNFELDGKANVNGTQIDVPLKYSINV